MRGIVPFYLITKKFIYRVPFLKDRRQRMVILKESNLKKIYFNFYKMKMRCFVRAEDLREE